MYYVGDHSPTDTPSNFYTTYFSKTFAVGVSIKHLRYLLNYYLEVVH